MSKLEQIKYSNSIKIAKECGRVGAIPPETSVYVQVSDEMKRNDNKRSALETLDERGYLLAR